MGQAKNRGSQKERIELAERRNKAINDRMRRFIQEVHAFTKKTGLELGAVKLDARFCIVKFDDIVKFVKQLPVTEAEVLADLRPRVEENTVIPINPVDAPYQPARSMSKDPSH